MASRRTGGPSLGHEEGVQEYGRTGVREGVQEYAREGVHVPFAVRAFLEEFSPKRGVSRQNQLF